MSSFKRSSLSLSVIIEGNDDLLMEILLFLPAKSLVSFRAVSKRWRSLISDPLFRRRHTLHLRRRSEAQPLFFLRSDRLNYLVYNPTIPKSFPFSFPIGFRNMPILQSSKGLLLLRRTSGGDSYHVFNPTTMERRDLPPLPSGASVAGIYLIFDPSLSLHYRVICFLRAQRRRCITIYLYDSETHIWKLGGERKVRASRFSSGIYFNGGICFRDGSSWSWTHMLDPDDNVTEIPNPHAHDAVRGRSSWSRCVESNGGVLFGLTYCWKDRSNLLYVSEMKEKDGRWSEKRCVDLNPIFASYSAVERYADRFLGMIRGEKEEEYLLLLLGSRGKILRFKFNDEVFEVDKETRKGFPEGDSVREAHPFIVSLAPV